jgi:cholest-4-en-3-one 26-monooxygenase
MTTTSVDPSTIDVLNPDTYLHGDPETNGMPWAHYEWLRANAPVFNQRIEEPLMLTHSWVISRHADCMMIDRDAARFASTDGVMLKTVDVSVPHRGGRRLMMTMDGEDHVRNRRVVSRGLKPAMVRALEPSYTAMCTKIVENALSIGAPFDFMKEVAAKFPLQAFCELVGVPEGDRPSLHAWSTVIGNTTDPTLAPSIEAVMEAANNVWEYGAKLAAIKRECPAEDLMSRVAAAHESEQLNDDEMKAMFMMLTNGGDETTRNALGHGLHAFFRFPEQMELFRSDPEGLVDTAVEEVLRWSTPVVTVRRTVTEPVELHGQRLEVDDKVSILYASANFDETVFDNPYQFDITRSPNPHLSMGTGPHVCLGAAVARLELKTMFLTLLRNTELIRQTGPIQYVRESFLRPVRHLPVEFV